MLLNWWSLNWFFNWLDRLWSWLRIFSCAGRFAQAACMLPLCLAAIAGGHLPPPSSLDLTELRNPSSMWAAAIESSLARASVRRAVAAAI